MSLQVTGRPATPPDYDEAIDPVYDEGADLDYDEASDPDYDESSQGEFADEFTDADPGEAPSQEYYKRSQK